MTKSFCVAGHTFNLELPDASPLWPLLSQYKDFETPLAEDPLFTVTQAERLPVEEWTPLLVPEAEDKGQPRLDLYSCAGGYVVEMALLSTLPACARFFISEDYRSGVLVFLTPSQKSGLFAVNNALMLLYAFASAPFMTLEMHASVVEKDGKGFLFLGKSGTGKSTHSSLWLKYIEGSELMNDDNPVLRVDADGTTRVYGSPWSGKTPCYRNISAPVGAIVRIRQAPFNSITRQSVLEAYASIYSSCSGFKADRGMADGQHKALEQIVLNVPCYTLDCLPDEEAAMVCSAEVLKG